MKKILTFFLVFIVFKGLGQDYLKTMDSITQKIKPQYNNLAFAIDTTKSLNLTGDVVPIRDIKDPEKVIGYVVDIAYHDNKGQLKKRITIDRIASITYYYNDNYLIIADIQKINSKKRNQYYYTKDDNRISSDELSKKIKLYPALTNYYSYLKEGRLYKETM